MTATLTPDYLRQRGIFDPAAHEGAAVTFVGVGGIGSFASRAVAKLGIPNITLIDPDIVEPHNLPSQMFDTTQAYDLKVIAATTNIMVESPECNLNWHAARITEDGWTSDDEGLPAAKPNGLVVSGLDSMKARHDLWHQCLRMNPLTKLYIDGRLDGQTLVIYAVKPWDLTDIEQYEATLLSDDEVGAGSCTERAIIDVGFMMASLISRMVRLHYSGEDVPKITVVQQASLDVAHGGWLV